jgi:UDP-N-acetyl-D-mannosaminuronate dehydrogenase
MMSPTAVASQVETLQAKIMTRTARVGIVGLGYVGLPLAVEFAKEGFSVTGIDLMGSKIESIHFGRSYVQDRYYVKVIPENQHKAVADFERSVMKNGRKRRSKTKPGGSLMIG